MFGGIALITFINMGRFVLIGGGTILWARNSGLQMRREGSERELASLFSAPVYGCDMIGCFQPCCLGFPIITADTLTCLQKSTLPPLNCQSVLSQQEKELRHLRREMFHLWDS